MNGGMDTYKLYSNSIRLLIYISSQFRRILGHILYERCMAGLCKFSETSLNYIVVLQRHVNAKSRLRAFINFNYVYILQKKPLSRPLLLG